MSSNSTTTTANNQMDTVLFIICYVQLTISAIGLPLNSFLIFCMLKNKELRASCCTLFLLLLAIDDWLCEFLIIAVPTILALSRTTISLAACFPLGTLSYFANSYAQSLIFLISADRLVSILCPLTYEIFSRHYKRKYVFILPSIPFIWISIFLYHSYLFMLSDPTKQVFCMPTDPISPAMNSINFLLVSCFNVAAFLIYSFIWLLIKCKVIKLLQNSLEQRVLKSLSALILLVFFFGIPAPISANFVLPQLQMSAATKSVIFRGLLQLNKVVQTVNAPILYLCSYDFRAVMRKELARIFQRNRITPAGSQLMNTTGNENAMGPPVVNNLMGTNN